MEIRIRLRPWLESRLNEGWIEGLSWIDREKGVFKIPWKHHSKHTWTEGDAAIFKDWAVVTGRYRAGVDEPDWPMWKTRLRCALNKAPDIQEVRQRHDLHCDEPFKVYRFMSKTESLWRANATRNASMIFDGFSQANKLGMVHLSDVIKPDIFRSNTMGPKRTAIVVQKTTGLQTDSRPLTLVQRRTGGVVLQQWPLLQPNRTVSLTRQSEISHTGIINFATTEYSSNSTDCTDSFVCTPSSRVTVLPNRSTHTLIQRFNGSSELPMRLLPSNAALSSASSTFLPDTMEPERHQLAVRVQHLNVRVKDAIITNPNGCCIYFGRYDEISSPAAPDSVEAQIPHHVSEANKDYVDLLLENMVRGVMLSVTQGSIYAERLCKCAVFVYVPTSTNDFALLKKMGRRERELIFNYNEFLRELRLYHNSQSAKPHFEVILAFGQQLRPNLGTNSLLIWCRVASCRAWFQLHKDHPLSSTLPEVCGTDFIQDGDVVHVRNTAYCSQYGTIHSRSECPPVSVFVNNSNFESASYVSCGTTNAIVNTLDAVVEHTSLVNPLEQYISRNTDIIEEGVEVPLDGRVESLVYDTADNLMDNGCPDILASVCDPNIHKVLSGATELTHLKEET